MHRKVKVGILVSISALSLSMVCASSVSAQDTSPAQLQMNLENRKVQLTGLLERGIQMGIIRSSEARRLQDRMADITARQNRYVNDSRGLSWGESQELANDYNSIDVQIQAALNNNNNSAGANASYRSNASYGSNNAAQLQTNLENRKAQLAASIDQGIQSGRLTSSESRRLRNRLNDISAKQNQFVNDYRGLRWRESQELANDYNKLDEQIQKALANNDNARGHHGRGGDIGWRGR